MAAEMNLDLLNYFVSSTVEVLELTCQSQATRTKSFARPNDFKFSDISATVPMKTPQLIGCMAVGFPQDVFLAMVGNMFGEEYQQIDDENKDAIGEIANQIFGKAKAHLADVGLTLEPAIPCITIEEKHPIFHPVDGPCIVSEFQSDFGVFCLELSTLK